MHSEAASSHESGVIARSRSRYKGSRQINANINAHTAPDGRPGQLQGSIHCASGPGNGKGIGKHDLGHGILDHSASYLPAPRSNIKNGRELPVSHKQAEGLPNVQGNPWPERFVVEDSTLNTRQRRGEDFNSRVVNEKLSLEFKAPQQCKAHIPPEGLPRITSEAQSSHDLTSRRHVHSAQKPSGHIYIKNQVSSKNTPAKKDQAPSKPSTLQKRSLTHRHRGADTKEDLKRTISAPMPVEPVEHSIKPAFDAPVSAVNAGERRVLVHFNEQVLSVPVLPSTTPQDIFRETSSQLSIPIDAESNVLVESFKQLGLERPLRDYEHVRDVLNSWDRDSQNALNIVPSPRADAVHELDMKSVPQLQPGDTSVHIYHSNAPGHWDRRWISLRSDGQVVMLKKRRQGKLQYLSCLGFRYLQPDETANG